MAVNRGGEEHTFTEVESFGGGIVPALNALSGNPDVAPECLALEADDYIQPGRFDAGDEVEEPGTEHYQCCIHHAPAVASSRLVSMGRCEAGRTHRLW